MATQAEQLPLLQLAELTAAQFIDIWKHFDTDGQCAPPSIHQRAHNYLHYRPEKQDRTRTLTGNEDNLTD